MDEDDTALANRLIIFARAMLQEQEADPSELEVIVLAGIVAGNIIHFIEGRGL